MLVAAAHPSSCPHAHHPVRPEAAQGFVCTYCQAPGLLGSVCALGAPVHGLPDTPCTRQPHARRQLNSAQRSPMLTAAGVVHSFIAACDRKDHTSMLVCARQTRTLPLRIRAEHPPRTARLPALSPMAHLSLEPIERQRMRIHRDRPPTQRTRRARHSSRVVTPPRHACNVRKPNRECGQLRVHKSRGGRTHRAWCPSSTARASGRLAIEGAQQKE